MWTEGAAWPANKNQLVKDYLPHAHVHLNLLVSIDLWVNWTTRYAHRGVVTGWALGLLTASAIRHSPSRGSQRQQQPIWWKKTFLKFSCSTCALTLNFSVTKSLELIISFRRHLTDTLVCKPLATTYRAHWRYSNYMRYANSQFTYLLI